EFYHMQLKIYGLLLDQMDLLVDTGFDERREDIQEKMKVLTLLGRRAKHEERRNVVIVFENGTELVDEIEEYDHEDDMPPPYTASPTNYIKRNK
ncbi:1383_t:CDS:2, partial [Ambispora gerdemannii]